MKKENVSRIPEIKKTINAFLVGEEGKISKQSIIKAGVVLSAVSLGALSSVVASHSSNHSSQTPHINSIQGVDYQGPQAGIASSTHSHHASHSNSHSNSHSSAHESAAEPPPAHSSAHSSGGCCFPAGTLVSTPRGDIAIEKIKIGDIILAYDLKNKRLVNARVLKLESPIREGIYKINKNLIDVTNEHPFYTRKKGGKIGWAAIEKIAAMKECKKLSGIMTLEAGDFIFDKSKRWIKVKSIEYVPGNIKTYNLKNVSGYNNFFVEGLLVHNKGYY